MAAVYLAHDLKHDRPVALKVLRPEVAEAAGTHRFEREIRLAARLQHPHICSVYDSGLAAGQLWFTMPFVEGESLDARLAREGRLPPDEALRIVREAAQALAYAHDHGVIHRDIKPANLLLARDGSTLVADFGIARLRPGIESARTLTETGFSPGTPAYMSPEQAAGVTDLDGRSDIYSLGIVLYEMLLGERPWKGGPLAGIAQQATNPLRRVADRLPEAPAGVEPLLARALAPNPTDRFATMAEFGAALESLRTGSGPATPLPVPRRHLVRLSLAAAGVAALGAAWLLLGRAARQPASAPPASAAVLPFTDLSPSQDEVYFSDGLTEDLTTALARIPGLRLAARSSAFQFRGPAVDVREVGRRLGVGSVLEGSVRRTGDRLRVSARLINADDGYELWSESYDRKLADVFAVQGEIARAIAAALRVRLGAGADSVLASPATGDLVAYDLYLKGQFALNQRSEQTLPEAVRYFEQAVARDPGMARAWAGLADGYVLLPLYTGASPETTWPRAREAAARAIQLGGGGAEAHSALAYGTMLYQWDWAAAEEEFKRALAADSTNPSPYHWYGDFLAGRGRLEEGLAAMRRAQELDPLSRIIGVEVGWIYALMGRNAEADSAVNATLRLDPNFAQGTYILGLVRLQQGRAREAVEVLRHSLESGGFNAHTASVLIAAHVAAGDRVSARRLLDTLQTRARHEYVPPFAFAAGYAALGDLDRAFAWLDRGITERDVLLPECFLESLFDPLKKDSRYRRVAERLGVLTPAT